MHPNFREFYQKALLPIGELDKQVFHHTFHGDHEQLTFATHWLVALEGNPVQKNSEKYHWQVLVYPSNIDGVFHYKYPHFVSEYMNTMDHAIELARELENRAKNEGICHCSCQLNLNVV